MTLLPAWAVDGGRIPAAMARRIAWAATSGATGVALPTDLQVVPRSTTGPGVVIRPGGGVLENRFAGASGESYEIYNDADLDVPVPTTSGSGRTDYLGIRIDDPQFPGNSAPTDPLAATYCRPVLVSSIPTTYPFLLLAKIVQPAGNGAVTAGMITDMREVANPRVWTVVRPKAATVSTTETLSATGTAGEWFPNAGGDQLIDIPKWATRVQIRADWLMVRYPAGSNAFGRCWVEFGPYKAPSEREVKSQEFQFDSAAVANVDRRSWHCVDDIYIPSSYRGTAQIFVMKARLDSSITSANRPQVDSLSGTSLEVRFLEVADSSTS